MNRCHLQGIRCFVLGISCRIHMLPSMVFSQGPRSFLPSKHLAGCNDAEAKIQGKIRALASHPHVRRISVIFRHGEKQRVERNGASSDADFWKQEIEAALTERGFQQAEEFGSELFEMLACCGSPPVRCVGLLSSPVPRCKDTIRAVADAAAVALPVEDSDPWMNATHVRGEEREAANKMRSKGWQPIMSSLARGEHVEGFASLGEVARKLRGTCGFLPIDRARNVEEEPLEIVLVCTHDVMLYALAAWFVDEKEPKKPDFLEKALWWTDGQKEFFFYDGSEIARDVKRLA